MKCKMKSAVLISILLLTFAAGAARAQGLTGQEKQILPMIKANWLAFRNYSGRQLIYFSNLLAYRCGLSDIRYSINSDALDRSFPLPPCDPAQPQSLDAVKYPPFVTLALGTAKQVTVQAIFKDGSTTDMVRFKPCDSAGDSTCSSPVP
jgi:hypothetical protein